MKKVLFSFLLVIIFIGFLLSNSGLNWGRYLSYLTNAGDPHLVPTIDWYQPKSIISADNTQPFQTSDNKNISDSTLEKIIQYALNDGGHAILIAQNGKLIVEKYSGNNSRDTLINPQSMSKSLLSVAVGLAITQGKIKSVNDPIRVYLPELKGEEKGIITIKNLLQMAAGLEQISADYKPWNPWSRSVQQNFGKRFNYWVMQLKLSDFPGTRFEYNNNESNLLGMVLESATGVPYQTFLKDEVWPKLKLGSASAYLDKPNGDVMKACCIFTRPIDWLSLGQLILDEGLFNGNRVVDKTYISAATSPSDLYKGYGYQIWLEPLQLNNGYVGIKQPDSVRTWWASEPYKDIVYSFAGYGFHQTWIIPSQEIVVVRINGNVWPKKPWDQSYIPNLLIK